MTDQPDWRTERWYAQESDIGVCITAGPTSPLKEGAYTVADLVRSQEIAEYIAALHNAKTEGEG